MDPLRIARSVGEKDQASAHGVCAWQPLCLIAIM
jgi:hypothetical protein